MTHLLRLSVDLYTAHHYTRLRARIIEASARSLIHVQLDIRSMIPDNMYFYKPTSSDLTDSFADHLHFHLHPSICFLGFHLDS